jgi:assimilatory nitrate reductase catalytic subunit
VGEPRCWALQACFLAPRGAALPSREFVADLLSASVERATRIDLLAGRRAQAEPTAETGRIVCACFAVGFDMLQRAITERQMTSAAEVGTALRAGTNCGSCIPELNTILRQARLATPTPTRCFDE